MPDKAQKHSRYSFHNHERPNGHSHSRGERDDDNWKRQVQRRQFGDDEDDRYSSRGRWHDDSES